jgi:hypothetical protein
MSFSEMMRLGQRMCLDAALALAVEDFPNCLVGARKRTVSIVKWKYVLLMEK